MHQNQINAIKFYYQIAINYHRAYDYIADQDKIQSSVLPLQREMESYHPEIDEFYDELPLVRLPYFDGGSSDAYVSQFLFCDELSEPQNRKSEPKSLQSLSEMADVPLAVSLPKKPSKKKRKRISLSKKQHVENVPSPFHNYQKHLLAALKIIVDLRSFQNSEEPEIKVALQLWRKVMHSNLKLKKMLLVIFNDSSKQQISNSEMRLFGLLDIFIKNQSIIQSSKRFLSKAVCQQLNQERIDSYLNNCRIKNKDGFRIYLEQFKKELMGGFLKKRIMKTVQQNS